MPACERPCERASVRACPHACAPAAVPAVAGDLGRIMKCALAAHTYGTSGVAELARAAARSRALWHMIARHVRRRLEHVSVAWRAHALGPSRPRPIEHV